jgi:pumilio family protein 6
MKEFWNSARVKTLSKEDREVLIQTMMKSVTGRILQVTLRHDASRAVQCILQFGSTQQRRLILEEMSAKLYEVIILFVCDNAFHTPY